MLAQLHDNIANHIMASLQNKTNFLNLIFNLDHFLICLIAQLRKKNVTRATAIEKCQGGNELPGLLALPAQFMHASETNGNILVKPNVFLKHSC